MRTVIEVGSPLAGWVWPLAATPDGAFADGLLGPGVAIDPVSSEVVAPFDGVVVTLNPSRHAVVVRHPAGPQILVHVGIDTVALAGQGFEALVAPGETVRRGQVLIRFDLDAVARAAPSLISPVILMEAAGYVLQGAAPDRETSAGAPLFQLHPTETTSIAASLPQDGLLERSVTVALPHGLHVRPAAALARLARERKIDGVMALEDGRTGDLLSPVSLLALGVARGDRVTLRVRGSSPDVAIEAMAALLEEELEPLVEPKHPDTAAEPRLQAPGEAGAIAGICGAPGRAAGPIHHWTPAPVGAGPAMGSPAREAVRLETALAAVASDLTAEVFWTQAGPVMASILEAHLTLARDPELCRLAMAEIAAGASAGGAWNAATEGFAARLEGAGEARLAGRAADLRDVATRVLWALDAGGEADDRTEAPAPGAILVARDLPPSALSRLAGAGLAGVCLSQSGPTAHVALIAASLGIPMLVNAGAAVMSLPAGAMMTLDADGGQIGPTQPIGPRGPSVQIGEVTDPGRPAVTLDGARITVMANLGGSEEVAGAVALGAEGCGLLRTEFLFTLGDKPPSQALQNESYARVLDALGDRPLVIRTLDVGADKPAPWLPFPREPNPALGRRGIRVALARPDLLATQLRAIAALPAESQVSIMAPMVTTLAELRAVRAALEAACRAIGRYVPPHLGVMVETPAAALIADRLAADADFLSIGTNDLAQYVLAADRMGPGGADAFDPAVLRAIALTLEGAAIHHRPVSVCGGLASDPLGAALLVGLGVRRLSCAPAAIPRIKATIQALEIEACQALALMALDADSANRVRDLARDALSRATGRG